MTNVLALILGFVAAFTVAEPIGASSRSSFARRADVDLQLASRSMSSSAASFAETSYDYVVVGGGTAGLALAARLSECGEYTVGVLEAGISGFGDPIIDIPGDFGADVGTIYDCVFWYQMETRLKAQWLVYRELHNRSWCWR